MCFGGGAYTGEGAKGSQFVEPTIFTGVSNDMRIAQEEVFGPVLSVIPFEDEADALRLVMILILGWQLVSGHLIWAVRSGCQNGSGQAQFGSTPTGCELYDAVWRL